jgi:hypothetical protein
MPKLGEPSSSLAIGIFAEYGQVDELYKCCDLFYQRNGDDASTVSCPKANLLR